MRRSFTILALVISTGCNLTATPCPIDGDGDGSPGPSFQLLVGKECPFEYTLTASDCDDNNPTVNPGAAEIGDGLDNNCDGLVDCNTGFLWCFDESWMVGDPQPVCDELLSGFCWMTSSFVYTCDEETPGQGYADCGPTP